MAIVGIGIDAVETARVRRACDRTPGLLDRLFTEQERATCTGGDGRLRYDSLAARFAAKEAVAKALGTGIRGFAWRDVEVISDDLGKPSVRLHGPAARRAEALGATSVHLSLSTATQTAFAHVVLEGQR